MFPFFSLVHHSVYYNNATFFLLYHFPIIGLQALHEITKSESYRLRVDLEDWEGNLAFAEYS